MNIEIVQEITENVIKIRTEVFIKEQSFQNEFDDIDDRAAHVLVMDESIPAATCRIFQDENGDYILGRLAVIKKYRGIGLGAIILEETERYVRKQGGSLIKLHAQCRVTEFYKKSGYVEFGNIENDEGVPHIWMKKLLDDKSQFEY